MESQEPRTDNTRKDETPTLEHGKPAPLLLLFLITPVLGIVVAVLMIAAEQREPDAESSLPQVASNPASLIGSAAPDFQLMNLDGQPVALEDYRGQILFLNFWQTTCVPCITEMPEFEAFFADQDPDEVQLLAVNVAESEASIRDFFTEFEIGAIPVVLDSDQNVRRNYGVMGLPVTFVIDPSGFVRQMHIGGMDYADMEVLLEDTRAQLAAGS